MSTRAIVSSYDQPIIMSLTPWTKSRISSLGVSLDWPPFVDADRLARYDDFTALIENRATDVFDSLQLADEQNQRIALAAALPELISNVWADAVWSDPPTLTLPGAAETAWQKIDAANDFTEGGAWESVFSAAGWGTSVLHLYRDEERKAQFGTDVVIEEIDPRIYFPILKAGSSRVVEAVVLAWEEDRSAGTDRDADVWQVRERHTVEDGQYTIVTDERRTRQALSSQAWSRVREERPEGVDFLPFVDLHAKRWRGRYWGVSELSRSFTLFDEIDNTLSNVAEILEYHGSPMLQVPASVIYGGTLTKGVDKTLGIRDPAQGPIARYITFDGQIQQQIAHLDKIIELVFLTSEVPRSYFGLGTEAAPQSGVSMKLMLQNYLKKAARWQRAESMRLRTLVPMALRLDGQEGAIPEIAHGSPLPADDEQTVRIAQAAVTAKLLSRKSGVRVMKRLGFIDDVDEELAEIETEREESIAALPAAMRSPGGGNSSTDPNDGDEPPA